MNADHLKAENLALRTCLHALLSEEGCCAYSEIKDGVGEQGLVLNSLVRMAVGILAVIRGYRDDGTGSPAPSWESVGLVFASDVEERTAEKIAAWIENNEPPEYMDCMLVEDIRKGAWK